MPYWNRCSSDMPTCCGQTIQTRQSATLTFLASGVKEFARLGYIELVDARTGIPDGLPAFLVRTIKRAKHQPIWIPGPNFPDKPWEIYELMKPSLRGDEVVWQHFPAKHPSTWRDRAAPMLRLVVGRRR